MNEKVRSKQEGAEEGGIWRGKDIKRFNSVDLILQWLQ